VGIAYGSTIRTHRDPERVEHLIRPLQGRYICLGPVSGGALPPAIEFVPFGDASCRLPPGTMSIGRSDSYAEDKELSDITGITFSFLLFTFALCQVLRTDWHRWPGTCSR